MKKLQVKFLKSYNRIIVAFLALLGFSCSCETRVEYGSPHAKFNVNGKVSSVETDLPIKNIKVIMQGDTTFTDDEGNYQINDKWGYFPTDQTFAIQFQDIDDELNGKYQDLDTIVEFIDPEFTGGDGSWYEGETTKEFDVKIRTEK